MGERREIHRRREVADPTDWAFEDEHGREVFRQEPCHRLHSRPSDHRSYVCGDKRRCDQCPAQYTQTGRHTPSIASRMWAGGYVRSGGPGGGVRRAIG